MNDLPPLSKRLALRNARHQVKMWEDELQERAKSLHKAQSILDSTVRDMISASSAYILSQQALDKLLRRDRDVAEKPTNS